MGKYAITIEGVGCHHNLPVNQKDAEVMGRRFVQDLKNAGHSITKAEMAAEGKEVEDLTKPAAKLSDSPLADQGHP